jgi:hypothetical protein
MFIKPINITTKIIAFTLPLSVFCLLLLILDMIVSNPLTSVSGQLIIKIKSKDDSINNYSEESFRLKAGMDAVKKPEDEKNNVLEDMKEGELADIINGVHPAYDIPFRLPSFIPFP